MYLTAHRVRTADGGEGVNAVLYRHPFADWVVPPSELPDDDPGELTQILDPDLIWEDGTEWAESRRDFITFAAGAQQQPLPWEGVVGRCLFRMGFDRGIASGWSHEMAILYSHSERVVHLEWPDS
ncbi:MAG: hypothetical protein EXR72_19790 [Myxococcales bacterium]|nr:hypothetical protein [Myxococcales bacterium]